MIQKLIQKRQLAKRRKAFVKKTWKFYVKNSPFLTLYEAVFCCLGMERFKLSIYPSDKELAIAYKTELKVWVLKNLDFTTDKVRVRKRYASTNIINKGDIYGRNTVD